MSATVALTAAALLLGGCGDADGTATSSGLEFSVEKTEAEGETQTQVLRDHEKDLAALAVAYKTADAKDVDFLRYWIDLAREAHTKEIDQLKSDGHAWAGIIRVYDRQARKMSGGSYYVTYCTDRSGLKVVDTDTGTNTGDSVDSPASADGTYEFHEEFLHQVDSDHWQVTKAQWAADDKVCAKKA